MIRQQVGNALRRLGLRDGSPPPWVVAAEAPVPARPLDDVRLFAVLGAWMEEDVIGATVANAFAQGCERVYVVDNDSTDDTVAEALAAGAELAATFSTDEYDERLRLDIMNGVVDRISNQEGAEHIWWLWLDADEFPHGPKGATLAEYLRGLDRMYRIVGGRFINHYPSTTPAYVPRFHPLDFQPLGEEHAFGCGRNHRKHPLQRFDRSGPPIVCDRGFHRASSEERPLREPMDAVFVHHFPFRDEAVTRARLARLCANDASGATRVRAGDDAADGMVPRFQTLDAVYRGDWVNVRNYRVDTEYTVARPVPWTTLVSAEDAHFARWYDRDDAARAASSAPGAPGTPASVED
jgi:hypothetical protein